MSAPEHILLKIKLLISLTKSPNPNEADNAKAMADKLIAKYNITPEEIKGLEDKKPLYSDNDKLFVTIGLVGWRQQLALAVGKHFDCQIIQEELVPVEGLHQFNYYVYGEHDDAETVKFVFNTFVNKVEELIKIKCIGRGPTYVASYGEGVIESIKNNIYWDGIQVPKMKAPSRTLAQEDNILNNGTSNLAKPAKEGKEKPAEASVDVNTQSLIKDINAYFHGLDDGKNIMLDDILELEVENEKIKELQVGQDGEAQ